MTDPTLLQAFDAAIEPDTLPITISLEVPATKKRSRVEHRSSRSGGRDDWETPQDLFDRLYRIYRFDLDAAASEANRKCISWWSEEGDALQLPWEGVTFCNPPYSRWQEFVVKANTEAHLRAPVVVMLLPARTDTKAFHEIILPYAYHVEFLRGRLKFELNGEPVRDKHGRAVGAPFPSMIVEFRRRG